jgi:hypothetical protein
LRTLAAVAARKDFAKQNALTDWQTRVSLADTQLYVFVNGAVGCVVIEQKNAWLRNG